MFEVEIKYIFSALKPRENKIKLDEVLRISSLSFVHLDARSLIVEPKTTERTVKNNHFPIKRSMYFSKFMKKNCLLKASAAAFEDTKVNSTLTEFLWVDKENLTGTSKRMFELTSAVQYCVI